MSEEAGPVTGPPRNLVSGIIKAIRPRQWPKNLLVLAAPLAALGGNVTYSGSITGVANTVRLGGGGGTMTMVNPLTSGSVAFQPVPSCVR